MANVYLYPGQSSKNNVRLLVYATVFFSLVGVGASPAIGTGSIAVTYAISGVAASPAIGVAARFDVANLITGVSGAAAIGAARVDATFGISGVSAASAIGAARIDATFSSAGVAATPTIGATIRVDASELLTGVFGNAGIGIGAYNADFAISGVVSNAAIGVTRIDVQSLLTGVAASPAIGVGEVTEDEIVTASGVAAAPAIGIGNYDADFAISGVVAGANIGTTQIDVASILGSVAASPEIGIGTVVTGSDVIVDLEGVSATPAIGSGTVTIARRSVGIGEPLRTRRTTRKPVEFIFEDITVSGKGIVAAPRSGIPSLIVDTEIETLGVYTLCDVGNVTANSTAHVDGVSANAETGTGELEVSSGIKGPSKLTVIDGRSMVDITLSTGAAPVPIIAVGYGALRINAELFEDEILALLDAA